MKKILLSIVALAAITVSTVSAQAPQGWTFGPKAGITISNGTNQPSDANSKYKVGFTGGAFVEYGLSNEWLGLSAEVLYSSQGAKQDDYTDEGVKITDNKENLNYLNIPILAKFYVLRGLSINAGIQPGFLLGAKGSWKEDGHKESRTGTEGLKTFDFSVPVGLSYSFDCGLIIDARYNIGVTKVPDFVDAPNSKNSVFAVTLGWRF